MPTTDDGTLFPSSIKKTIQMIPRRGSKQHSTNKNSSDSCNLTSEFNTSTVSLLVQQVVKQKP